MLLNRARQVQARPKMSYHVGLIKHLKPKDEHTAGGRVGLNTEWSVLYGHSVTSDGCFISSAESMWRSGTTLNAYRYLAMQTQTLHYQLMN